MERAAPALFSLPAQGRLLVSADTGTWLVRRDGSRRLLGPYRDAAWSPFGRFVVGVRRNEVAARDPSGRVRWTLARPAVRRPAWGGSRTDTRIAYLSGSGIRVVAGDGTGDRAACAEAAADVRPAWRPGPRHVLASAAPNGSVRVYDVDGCRLLLRTAAFGAVRRLEWSSDGALLLVLGDRWLRVLDAQGRRRFALLDPSAAPFVTAAFTPGRHGLAFVQRAGARSDLWVVPAIGPDRSASRRVFSGQGAFTDLAWSPDGRWLLLAWREADQWLFVRSAGVRRVQAVSEIARQFRARSFPEVGGWCCASSS